MKFFGIRNKTSRKWLGWNAESNGGDLEEGVSFTFREDSFENVWLVADRALAEEALRSCPAWEDARFRTPAWERWGQGLNPKNYEVFEVDI